MNNLKLPRFKNDQHFILDKKYFAICYWSDKTRELY